MNCPYCGGNMPSGSNHCPNCGAAVEQTPTAAAASFGGSEAASPKHVNMPEAIKLFFMNYVKFDGRSTRSEYWWVVLFNFLVGFVLGLTGIQILATLYSAAVLIPGIAVAVRRLHDIGKSGWWYLIALTGIGAFVLIYWFAQPSVSQNQWGNSADELGR